MNEQTLSMVGSQAQAQAFMAGVYAAKSKAPGRYYDNTVAGRYERLREQYVTGAIELEDFTAEVVGLLHEGL